jgi:ABC-type multidrug transport system ATPase subunit
MVLLGPNGCGKSTVLKALTGILPPLEAGSSDRTLGEGLEMGVFTQDLAQDLPQDQIAVDYVLATVRQKDMSITDQQARGALGALGLMGEKAMRPISALSGGEKARVALSVFALLPHNLLVLDEPSNHLDIGTTETLSEALAEFRGTLVVISHNKGFVEKLKVTHVGLIRDRRLIIEERMLRPSDWAFDTHTGGSGGPSKAVVKSSGSKGSSKASDGKQGVAVADGGKANYQDQRARFKKLSAAPKRIAKLQLIIEEKERKVEEYGKKMYHAGSDVAKVMEFSERKEALASEVEALYAEWDELEAMLAEKNGQ